MPAPVNLFKQRLLAGETLIGCWLSLGEGPTAEIMGTAGFDWLLIDGEHAPNDLRSIRDQLLALESSPSSSLVRVPSGVDWLMKQMLDAGAQTLLVPMVETAEDAEAMVKACRFPRAGIRGVGAAAARSGRFGSIPDYMSTADAQICVLVQVESLKGVENLDEILQVDGLDGVFVGPADLASDMGLQGNAMHPETVKMVCDVITRIAASGKAPGSLAIDNAIARQYLAAGARFLAVGIDVLLMVKTARDLAARFKET
ncbi:MAG: HpcH/HpaI aldolase/citrate lyase family protein [Pseudomonadota bacterium]